MAFEIEAYFAGVQEPNSAIALTVPAVSDREQSARTAFRSPVLSTAPAAISISTVCDLFLSDPTSARTTESSHTYRTTYAAIVEIVGAEMPITSIGRGTCRAILGILRKLPANARKRWPNTTLREIADIAVAQGIPPMSTANANEYMNKLSGLFNWAIKEEIVASNPASGLRIPDATAARDRRLPLSVRQLQQIFDAPVYRGCRDDEHGYAEPGNAKPKRSRFWIPAIALFEVVPPVWTVWRLC
jgi:hypothetical protein